MSWYLHYTLIKVERYIEFVHVHTTHIHNHMHIRETQTHAQLDRKATVS